MSGLICCPRCGHHNPLRAKYCAQCGVNLALAGAESPEWPRTRRRRRWPGLLLLLVILAGVWLLGVILQNSGRCRRPLTPREQRQGLRAVESRDQAEDEHVITRESTWVIEY